MPDKPLWTLHPEEMAALRQALVPEEGLSVAAQWEAIQILHACQTFLVRFPAPEAREGLLLTLGQLWLAAQQDALGYDQAQTLLYWYQRLVPMIAAQYAEDDGDGTDPPPP